MPQDEHWLTTSCEVIPPQKLAFPRQKKKKILGKYCCFCLCGFSSKSSGQVLILFRTFFMEILSRQFRILRTTSNFALKNGKFQPKLRFSFFPAKITHAVLDLRTTSDPTHLIQPRPVDCDRGSIQPGKIFLQYLPPFFGRAPKNRFYQIPYKLALPRKAFFATFCRAKIDP